LLTLLSGECSLRAHITNKPNSVNVTDAELDAMNLIAPDARPHWDDSGIGFPGTQAQPERGRRHTATSRPGTLISILFV
jgi:hypothetical protein